MDIEQILDGAESMEMVIPEFQREYIWSIEDAKQLMVSLFKRYPTGSFLFWETDNPPEIKNEAVNKERFGLTKVILDGQQRLTTLYLIIKGTIPPYYNEEDILNDPRHLFFNLHTGDFQYYMKSKMHTNPIWQKVNDCFNEKKVDAFDIAEQYIEINQEVEFKETLKKINNNLLNLRGIENIEYSVLHVPKSASVDEAIDIFDKVNSQGTKLTDAELVLTHITGRWPHARRDMKKKIQKMKKFGFSFNLDFMTRCIVVTLTDSALFKKNAKLKYTNFSADEYIEAWQKVSKALDYLIPILQQDGLISSTNDLSTNNILVPIIAFLVNNNNRFTGSLKHRFLYWMFLAMIWSRYSGQTDQRLDKDVHITLGNNNPIQGLINEIEDQRGRIDVKSSDLEGRAAGHPLYKMLYIITKSNKAIDWANGGAIYGTIGDYYSIHSHHIFPQSYLYRNNYNSENLLDRKKVNEIANRAFITRDTNYSIGNKSPLEYLPLVEEKYPGALEKQFIIADPNLWDVENYENFLSKRRNIIATEINSYLETLSLKVSKEEPVEVEAKLDKYKDIFLKGENNFVEFKSTLRYCLKEEQPMKYIEKMIAKTICAFLNSEGGTLFVGVDDEGNILGLENDFKTFSKDNPIDPFLLKFDQIIKNYLGNENIADISAKIDTVEDKDILIVNTTSSNRPVFLRTDGREEFYVRGSASSQPYSMSETLDYINRHWNT